MLFNLLTKINVKFYVHIRPKLLTSGIFIILSSINEDVRKKNKIKKHTIYLINIIIYHVYIKKKNIFIRQNKRPNIILNQFKPLTVVYRTKQLSLQVKLFQEI